MATPLEAEPNILGNRSLYCAECRSLRRLTPSSIDLLHLRGFICSPLNFLERGKVVVVTQTLIVVIDVKPNLIMRWMRPANCVGSSKLKPEVNNDVSKRSQIKSFTVLSDLSAAAFFLSSVMMECLGFTSMVFFDTM